MIDSEPDPESDLTPSTEDSFISPIAMENDPDELFAGDRGVLDPEVRRVLVRLLQRRFLLADKYPGDWSVLLEHQQMVESRLNDLFIRLVVDHDRGVAYKQQIRSDELDIPILLRDEPYTRAETLVLVHLRTVYQRESTAGEASARVDIEDVEQTVLTYFAEADGDTARRQKTIRSALARLRQEGVIDEESEGRYRISPLVEILLSSERLRELLDWLQEQTAQSRPIDLDDEPETDNDLELAVEDEYEGVAL
jgi:predicted transcriptional regulator